MNKTEENIFIYMLSLYTFSKFPNKNYNEIKNIANASQESEFWRITVKGVTKKLLNFQQFFTK